MTSEYYEHFIGDFPEYESSAKIERAFEIMVDAHKSQVRKSGEPYAIHPYHVARILAEMKFDEVTICSGLLHDVIEDTVVTYDELRSEFGKEIANIVEGVTKLNKIDFKSKEDAHAESLRKMFLAMASDIRVIIVKMADRLHNMRTIRFHKPEKQREKAIETLEIYAPIARRLGIYVFEGEFENISLQVLEPVAYNEIKEKLEALSTERKEMIDSLVEQVSEKVKKLGITNAEVMGRSKKIYSIYKKMQRKGLSFEELNDIFAVRVIVDTVGECYGVIGELHQGWRPIPNRFKDYIAVPKENRYQSLHDTLLGDNGIPFEVQIRTREMHAVAEYGIAAHWMYKENGSVVPEVNKIAWINELIDWQKDTTDTEEFMENLKVNFFSDNVFVFTPKGDVKDLVKGSTPLDFAYGVHSDVGNKCVGARVNGRIVPLTYELKTGDIVEINTSSNAKPSRDWLNVVKTPSAKNKIRAWFRRELKPENIRRGKELLENEVKREGIELSELLKPELLEPLFARYTLNGIDDMYAAVGYGGITYGQIISGLIREYRNTQKRKRSENDPKLSKNKTKTASESVTVKGYNDILVRFARCCNPIPGDNIVGFVTRGRGVTVHRRDCTNVISGNLDMSREIEVTWNRPKEQGTARFLAEMQIECSENRPGLMKDISEIIFNGGYSMSSIDARQNKNGNPIIKIGLEINAVVDLDTMINKIAGIRSVEKVYRVNSQ